MYKAAFWTILVVIFVMCGTEQKEEKSALFIRVCDHLGNNCETYFPTKHSTVDTANLDIVQFVENSSNVFFGEKSADYGFLSYLSKDTLTILIRE